NGQHLVEISSDLEIFRELSESLNVQDNGIHKGQHLVEIPGPLPYINEQIVFVVNDTFPNWPIAEHYVGQYGCQKGFIPVKIRNKTDKNGRLTNLYFKCKFGGTYQPKKIVILQNQHNKGSKKLNCNWQLNLSLATGLIRITSFCDHHVEHQLSPDTMIFAPVNRRFSDECCEDIRHLVVNGRCDLSTIRSLVSAKYPDQLFLTRDLVNIVAQLRRDHHIEGNDASRLLTLLYEYKEADLNWYIKPLIDPVMQQLEDATRILPRVLMTDEDLSMKHVV
ncbi:17530_t:CDS:2, partial [Racocetra fulgida]